MAALLAVFTVLVLGSAGITAGALGASSVAVILLLPCAIAAFAAATLNWLILKSLKKENSGEDK